MPPLTHALSRNFSRDASGLLTRAGHERLLVICDTSFDVPDGAHEFYYLGNTDGDISAAAALREIAAACPLDRTLPGHYMKADDDDPGSHAAPARNHAALEALGIAAVGLLRHGAGGFYELSLGRSPSRAPLFCLTASASAYDNIAIPLGASQV